MKIKLALILFLFTQPVLGDIVYVSGNVSGTWTNDNIYVTEGDITISLGQVLTIEPGVIVKLYHDHSVYVDGSLNANGTESNQIIFTSIKDDANGGDTNGDGFSSTPAKEDWGRIFFESTSVDSNCVLNYCQLMYSGNDGSSSSDYPAIAVDRANPTITNVTLENNYMNGIDVVDGILSESILLDVTEIPYILRWDLTIPSVITATINPGVILKPCGDASIFVEGSLIANGTEDNQIIFTSIKDDANGGDTNGDGFSSTPAKEDWGRIKFESTSVDSNCVLNYCQLMYSGNDGSSSSDYPAIAVDRANPTITNVTLENNYMNGIEVTSGILSVDILLDVTEIPYILRWDLTIPSVITATINPGVILKPCGDASIFVEGSLIANGTEDNQIIFTSIKDDANGGDTNGDGFSSTPAKEDWGRIKFESTSVDSNCVLNYCQLMYSGNDGSSSSDYPAIAVDRANPTITNVTLENNYMNGIEVTSGILSEDILLDVTGVSYILRADLTIPLGVTMSLDSGVIFKSNSYYNYINVYGTLTAIGSADNMVVFTSIKDDAYGGDTNNDGVSTGTAGDWDNIYFDGGGGTLDYCKFQYGDHYNDGIVRVYNSDPTITNTIMIHNNFNGIGVSSATYQQDMSFSNTGNPYIVLGDITLNEGNIMTLLPGVIFKFKDYHDALDIKGSLNAIGAEEDLIVFTSIKDDAYGGDTNNDGVSTGTAGDWDNIYFDGGGGTLDYCKFQYGDHYNDGVIHVNSSDPSITYSIFASNIIGISCSNGALPEINKNVFNGNTTYGVRNSDSGIIVNAENNYWGSPDGPGGSGTGSGDAVSNNVDYDPFIKYSELTAIIEDITSIVSSDIIMNYELHKIDELPVSIVTEYSEDDGLSWLTASITGVTTGITGFPYQDSLIWYSRTDLPNTDQEDIRFKIIPSDTAVGVSVETMSFHLDNFPPDSMSAYGLSGNDTISVTFNEAIDTVTALNPGNYSLNEGLTVASVVVVQEDLFPEIDPGLFTYGGEYNGSYYFVSAQSETWVNARTNCENLGGHLVTISDEEENNFVEILANTITENIWIGFTDEIEEGNWEWVTSEPVIYTNWNSGEPDNMLNEDHAALRYSDGKWYDVNGEKRYVMEIEITQSSGADVLLLLSPGQYLPDPATTVTLTTTNIADIYGNVIVDSLFASFLPDDDNENPIATIQNVTEEQNGDVTINYTLSDFEEDILSIRGEYSIDSGSNWQDAALVGITSGINSTNYSGSIIWDSEMDLPDFDSFSVKFRLIPTDADPNEGTPDETNVFHLDNYQLQSVNLSELTLEQSDSVLIDFVLSDTTVDILSLVVEYSIDSGDNWYSASISGEIEELDNTQYVGNFVWLSQDDLLGVDIEAMVLVTPYDNWSSGISDTISFHLDNNQPPVVIVSDIVSEQSGDVEISYSLIEVENDGITYEYFYSEDGGTTWVGANIEQVLQDSIVVWHSTEDLPSTDQTDIQVKVVPWDNDIGVSDSTDSFNLDNWHNHSVILDSITDEQSGEVEIGYLISDSTYDVVDLSFYYSVDSGLSWDLIDIVSAISEGGYDGSYVWDSEIQLDGEDVFDLRVAVISTDEWQTGGSDTISFHLDNNLVPTVQLTDIVGEQHIDVPFEFVLEDAEDDVLTYAFWYSVDNGLIWSEASISPGDGLAGRVVSPSRDRSVNGLNTISHKLRSSILRLRTLSSSDTLNVVWHSGDDIPNIDSDQVRFMITVEDNDAGIPDTTETFTVDNFQSHSILLSPIVEEQVDSVVIAFSLIDTTGDDLSILFEYSSNEGDTWMVCSLVGDTSGLGVGQYDGSVVWLSLEDLPGVDLQSVWLRSMPYDNWSSGIGDTILFHLDNNAPPVVTVDNVLSEQSEDVDISYSLYDAESDEVTCGYYYSEDGGMSWVDAAFEVVIPDSVVRWHSEEDIPLSDQTDIQFKVSPFDNDPGVPDSTANFHLDNWHLHTVALDDIVDEQSGDVEIVYLISDSTYDVVDLSFYYSVDSGLSWDLIDIVSAISEVGYDSSYLWDSEIQLDGEDVFDLRLAVVSTDGWQIGGSDTISFHLDNNLVPTVQLPDIVDEQHMDVSVEFVLEDAEDDVLTYAFWYSVDDGFTWSEASISSGDGLAGRVVSPSRDHSVNGLNTISHQLRSSILRLRTLSSSDTLNVVWHSGDDIPNIDSDQVRFMITVEDNDAGIPDTTETFTVDNFQSHSILLSPIVEEQVDSVVIAFSLVDTSGDDLSILFEYSSNEGDTWMVCSLVGDTSGLGVGQYDGSVVWSSLEDLPGVDLQSVWLRSMPYDNWSSGIGDTILFHLDNNAPPVVTVDNVLSEQSGDVDISYSLYDAESDEVTYGYYYSEDGGMSWVDAAFEVVIPDSVVRWHSEEDLPLSDQTDIQFKVSPFDNDMGISDSTANFHLDNWHLHTVAMDDIVGEQSGDVEIGYLVSDSTGDAIDLSFYYSVDSGVSWDLIDTLSAISEVGYDGSYVWGSEIQLDGEDVFDLRLAVVSTDGWQIGGSDTISFHLDNETGPQLIYAQEDVYPLPQNPIEVKFDRPMDPNSIEGNITISSMNVADLGTIEYIYLSQNNSVQIFLQDGIPSSDTLEVILYNDLRDTFGKGFDGNQDGDPQFSSVDDSTLLVHSFTTGDFDLDGLMGQSDIDLFTSGWWSNDPEKETGPAQGEIPHLVVQPDGMFDIEDLMTFVRFWDYSASQGFLSTSFDGTLNDNRLITDWDGHNLKLGLQSVDNISGVHFMINHDSTLVNELRLVKILHQNVDRIQVLHFTHKEEINATHHFLGFLQQIGAGEDTTWFLSLPLELEVNRIVELKVTYEYKISDISYTGSSVLRLEPVPDNFALHQNYPNPFNPTTTLRYDLPGQSHVKLLIYDILGREVKELVKCTQDAGYKSVIWDGTNDQGKNVSAGMYLYRISTGDYHAVKKMILLK